MTEVEYGGGGHRTRLRNDHEDQLVCYRVPPTPVYKGARGRPAGPWGRARRGGVLLLVGVGLPFPTPTRRGKARRRGRRKGGRRPPSLVQFGPEGEGARGLPWPALSLSPLRPMWPISSPGGFRYPSDTPVFSEITGTLPVFEYSRPIYQSLCIDHFETPHHVRDHIRDSELSSVHQNT